jgi:hypothetical protein
MQFDPTYTDSLPCLQEQDFACHVRVYICVESLIIMVLIDMELNEEYGSTGCYG